MSGQFARFETPLIVISEMRQHELEAQIMERVYGWERCVVWVNHTKYGPEHHSHPYTFDDNDIEELVYEANNASIPVSLNEVAHLSVKEVMQFIPDREKEHVTKANRIHQSTRESTSNFHEGWSD